MGSHKETNPSRIEFEKWVRKETAFSLARKSYPMTNWLDQPYQDSKVFLMWDAWQASRESLKVNQDKNFCWVVYFKDADRDMPLEGAVPCGVLLWANVDNNGSTLCWDGEVVAKSEEDILKFIQFTIDKLGFSVSDIDIWEE